MEINSFRQEMSDHGLDPGEIITDGVIHRFSTWGDSAGEKSGAYWHNGNVGWFQDWRTMEKPEIVEGELSKADQKALNGSFTGENNKVCRKALEEGIRRIWKAGTQPDGHPYLTKKGITAPLQVKQHEGCLIIPVFGINGELNGLQRIDAEGRKRFLTGTRKKGSFFSISGNGTYIICEGFSTGASLHETTGANIIVAFDAGNLANVARAILSKVDPKHIIIAGDNDIANERNIGAEMAEKAAKEIGCGFILPVFQNPDGKRTTDFNDLHRLEGIGAVKSQFEAFEERRAIQEESLKAENKIHAVCIESIAEAEVEDNPIIEGLLDENESLIVSAASGTGKSLFMNYLAMALGNPPQNGLWGLFPIPNRIRSLIVQSENSFKAFNKRLRKIFNACPEMKAGAKNVFILKVGNDCRLAGSLTDKEFQKVLIDNLLSVGAGNLVLDPLISYHGEDENDNAGMRRSLDCLSMICDQAGVSVMICHHNNKQNLTRGATSIRDWCSNMLLMDFEKKSGDSVILKITHDKARNYEQQPIFYLERTPDLQFLKCEKPGKQSKHVEAVVNSLKALGGYAGSQNLLKELVMRELNCSDATARRAINETLELKKAIIIPGIGKGNPNAYKLPE